MLGIILGYEFVQRKVEYFDLKKVHILIFVKNVISEIHHQRYASSIGVLLMGCIMYCLTYLGKAYELLLVSINYKIDT